MSLINKKSITVGIITLFVGVIAALGAAGLLSRSTTAQGKTVAFILNPEGKIDGAVLDTGDQVRFGAETGEIVSQQFKIGDLLTATGHAGTKSDYGRELRAETLQIGDQTITVLHSKPKPPRDGDKPKPYGGEGKRKPHPGDEKMPPAPQPKDVTAPGPDDNAAAPQPEPNAPKPEPLPTASVAGQVKIVLVGGKGEPRGLILSGGEQINLPKEVGDANLTFSPETQVSVEGETAQGGFGTFIRPTRLTMGTQTFSFNR